MARKKPPAEFTQQYRALCQRYGIKPGAKILLEQAEVNAKMETLLRSMSPEKRRNASQSYLLAQLQLRLSTHSKESRWKGQEYSPDTITKKMLFYLRYRAASFDLSELPRFLLDRRQPRVQLVMTRYAAVLRRELLEHKAYLKELRALPDPPLEQCQYIQTLIDQIAAEDPDPYLPFKRRSSPAK